MKKLMIAASVAVLGIAANAASFVWSTGIADRTGEDYQSGTVYLIAGDSAAQAAVVSTILAAGENWESVFNSQVSGAYNYATHADGELSNPAFGTVKSGAVSMDATAKDPYSFFELIKDGDGFLISEVIAGNVKETGATELTFSMEEAPVFDDSVKTYQGAGWYTAVPEPTSGLLLLLGVAGLALRRRRA